MSRPRVGCSDDGEHGRSRSAAGPRPPGRSACCPSPPCVAAPGGPCAVLFAEALGALNPQVPSRFCRSAFDGARAINIDRRRSVDENDKTPLLGASGTPARPWRNGEHFLDHVNRGRCERLADERDERLRASHGRASHASSSHSAAAATPAVARAQMKADLERLFGPDWTRARAR